MKFISAAGRFRLLLMLLFAFKGLHGYGQSRAQQACVYNFFHDWGYSVIGGLAHPLCTAESLDVQYDDANTWYVILTYKDGDDELSCTYKIKMASGFFSELSVYHCNSEDFGCFQGCNFIRDWLSRISQQDKERFQRLLGKALGEFSCQDVCLAGLYYRWLDKDYYNRFVNGY